MRRKLQRLLYQLAGTHSAAGGDAGERLADVFGTEYVQTTTISVDRSISEVRNFEDRLSVASGAGTTLTLTAEAPLTGEINVGGDGTIVNRAATTGIVSDHVATNFTSVGPTMLAGFTNEADIGGVSIHTRSFTNRANIGAIGVRIRANDTLTFNNSGTILGTAYGFPVFLATANLSALSAANDGTIDGGLAADLQFAATATAATANIVNKGTIRSTTDAVDIFVAATAGKGTLSLDNQGLIDGGTAGVAIVNRTDSANNTSLTAIALTNSGTIRTSRDGGVSEATDADGNVQTYVNPVATIVSRSTAGLTLGNKAGGLIAAEGQNSVAVLSTTGALTLTNDGTIRGKGVDTGTLHLAGAVQTGDADDYVRNNGTITGAIDLGNGNNRVENYGTIDGDVRFGSGNDSYTQSSNAVLTGTVDGGLGLNTLIVDLAGSGSFAALNYRNFQDLRQIGSGTIEIPTRPRSTRSPSERHLPCRRKQFDHQPRHVHHPGRPGGRRARLDDDGDALRRREGRDLRQRRNGQRQGERPGHFEPGSVAGDDDDQRQSVAGERVHHSVRNDFDDQRCADRQRQDRHRGWRDAHADRFASTHAGHDLQPHRRQRRHFRPFHDDRQGVHRSRLIVQTAKSVELRGQFMLQQGANAQAARVIDYLTRLAGIGARGDTGRGAVAARPQRL